MRLIDADVLKYALGSSDEAMRFDAMIDEMPTITPRPDWTPCAEGLPENSKMVLTTQLHSTEAVQAYYSNGSWYNAVNQPLSAESMLAWMPKPDPYNPDRKED